MDINVTITAYDNYVNASSDIIARTLLANALGSQISLTGVHEVKVVNATVAFAVTSAAYDFAQANKLVQRIIQDANAAIEEFNVNSQKVIDDAEGKFNNLNTEAQEAINNANTAVEKIKEVQLCMWPGVAVTKAYYAELQSDEAKWTAFMAKYDNYMLFVIESEDTGPVTPPAPTPTFRGFGSMFGFKFGGGTVTFKGFGSKFGFLFGA